MITAWRAARSVALIVAGFNLAHAASGRPIALGGVALCGYLAYCAGRRATDLAVRQRVDAELRRVGLAEPLPPRPSRWWRP